MGRKSGASPKADGVRWGDMEVEGDTSQPPVPERGCRESEVASEPRPLLIPKGENGRFPTGGLIGQNNDAAVWIIVEGEEDRGGAG